MADKKSCGQTQALKSWIQAVKAFWIEGIEELAFYNVVPLLTSNCSNVSTFLWLLVGIVKALKANYNPSYIMNIDPSSYIMNIEHRLSKSCQRSSRKRQHSQLCQKIKCCEKMAAKEGSKLKIRIRPLGLSRLFAFSFLLLIAIFRFPLWQLYFFTEHFVHFQMVGSIQIHMIFSKSVTLIKLIKISYSSTLTDTHFSVLWYNLLMPQFITWKYYKLMK